ncbi:MAG TPA: GntR family transcriptional regulator [Trebonia sp.]
MTDPRGNTELAYASIRQAIVEGRYGPGYRLIEQRIAEEFQLSRTPVREAIRILDTEGLVVTERNKGATVRGISTRDVLDLYALRSRLESLAAEMAAGRATAAHIDRLDRSIVDFDAAVRRPDAGSLEGARALNQANLAFHSTIVEAADYDRLARMLARAVDIPLVFRAFREFNRVEVERSALFHHLIRDAVAAGEPDRAGRLMTEHILQGRDVLIANLTDDDTSGDDPG